MTTKEIISKLKSHANPENTKGMARFGINPEGTLGISIPILMDIAKDIKKDKSLSRHIVAQQLWESGIHEGRILAALIDEPKLITREQAENWVKDFDSWDVCDQVCMRLFDKTPFSYNLAAEWCSRPEEFVRRAGFALIASLALHDKKKPDERLDIFYPLIIEYSTDERNFVKKAVNWALRQIGKQNLNLNRKAIECAEEILEKYPDSKPARWIANDALRELRSEKILKRLSS